MTDKEQHGFLNAPAAEVLALILIVGVAAILRFWAIDRLPPGLYRDEAQNGLDALRVLRGEWPIFFPANNGREPLYIYSLAPAIALWGRSPGALRVVSALWGTLTVPAIYWLGRELYDRRVALVAAALCAVTVWTLNLSRVAFRAVAMVPLLAVMLALLWRGLRRRRVGLMAAAGALYGLSLYAYLAARFAVVPLLLFMAYIALVQRERLWLRGWLAYALATALVAAPLALYFAGHWSETLGRASQVSILNPAINRGDLWGTLARHTVRAWGGFWYRGDFIPRHNVPLRPVFDPLVGAAFALGLGVAAWRSRRSPAWALALIWLLTMMLPTILAEDAPHMLRGSGVLPTLFFFPALGLVAASEWLASRTHQHVALAVVVGVLVVSGGLAGRDYARHLASEAAYYQFEAGAAELAATVNAFLGRGWQGEGLNAVDAPGSTERVAYIAPRLEQGWPAVRYLVPEDERLQVLDGDVSAPKAGTDVLLAMWPYDDHAEALSLLPRDRLVSVQEGARERGDLETESRLLYVVYRTDSPENIATEPLARWQEGIRLQGYRVEPLGPRSLAVTLYWEATQPLDAAYTVFCHALHDGERVGQHDGPPAGGYYGTQRWRAGDLVADRHVIDLATPLDPARCEFAVGLYRWDTMQHLVLLDEAGNPSSETRITLRR